MRELNYIDETIEKNVNPALRIGSFGRSALSTVYLMDCIEGMKHFPDKFFDLAVVDPPYGINITNDLGRRDEAFLKKSFISFKNKKWDKNIPTDEYFKELFRVSKNQIVWGGNYFDLPPTRGLIFWDKRFRGGKFADGELAWTSYNKSLRTFEYAGVIANKGKQHPTQKPIKLYDFCFQFAKMGKGQIVLDTHLGSQSSRIAANKAGLDFVGFEIDREYYDNGNKRFKNFVSQGVLF